jgi:hypothetical protein
MCWRHKVTYPPYRDRQLFSDLLRRIKGIPPAKFIDLSKWWREGNQWHCHWSGIVYLFLDSSLFSHSFSLYFLFPFPFIICSLLSVLFLLCHLPFRSVFITFFISHLLLCSSSSVSLFSCLLFYLPSSLYFSFPVLIFFNYLPYIFLFLLSITFLYLMLVSFSPFVYFLLYGRVGCKRKHCNNEECRSWGSAPSPHSLIIKL